MTRDETPDAQHAASVAPHERRIRILLAAVVLLALSAWLVTSIVEQRLVDQRAKREIARLEKYRDSLLAVADTLEQAADEAHRARKAVESFMGECRTADDIPHLGEHWIVAQNHGVEELFFYVPAGNHTLEFASTWSPIETKSTGGAAEAAAERRGKDETAAHKEVWRVPLLPESGYHLTVHSDYKPAPVEWRLTSNHPDFSERTERLSLGEFAPDGWSYRTTGVVAFPNQIERFSRTDLDEAVRRPPGVELLHGTLRGKVQEQRYRIEIDVRVTSDGPAHISAGDVHRVLALAQDRLLLQYDGGGKYSVRPADTAADRSE